MTYMGVEKDHSLGKTYTTYTIGIDDLHDDDYGWGAVYTITITESRNQWGDLNYISEVQFSLIAG